MPYHTIPYYIILYYTIFFSTLLYYTILYYYYTIERGGGYITRPDSAPVSLMWGLRH